MGGVWGDEDKRGFSSEGQPGWKADRELHPETGAPLPELTPHIPRALLANQMDSEVQVQCC